jgi:hypothetical protein
VIIIGDPGVGKVKFEKNGLPSSLFLYFFFYFFSGKTSFIRRYVQNAFRGDYKATIGVDFALKIVRWSENQTIKLQLWDIAGNIIPFSLIQQ